ncbi:MAG: hypothetical protein ACLFN9_19205 [Desulfococcaceae bacterium]
MNFPSWFGFTFLLLGLFVLAGFGLARLFAWLGMGKEKKVLRRAERRLHAIESRYDDFIQGMRKRGATANRLETLTGDALVILQPDIESLISTLDHPACVGVRLPLASSYFPTAISRLEALINRTTNAEGANPFTEADRRSVLNAFRNAIRSDLEARTLDPNWKK